jgi:hypothetical protein
MQEKKVTRRELFALPVVAAAAAGIASVELARTATDQPPHGPVLKSENRFILVGGRFGISIRHDYIDGEWRPCVAPELLEQACEGMTFGRFNGDVL